MINRLKKIFDSSTEQVSPADTHIAAAVLLVYAAQIDGQISNAESQLLDRLAGTAFGLSQQEAEALMSLARNKAEDSHDLYQWTSQINKSFDHAHKLHLMECLWKVVDADGYVDDYEASLLRRVAGLIYLSSKDSAVARRNARRDTPGN